MKKIALMLSLGLIAASTSGCFIFSTPAYSGQERGAMILRNWGYEWQQAQDDVDSALLLRPASRLTIWNVR
ncbi:MAG TPA: hypothetical protein VIL86_02905 [Tepidisphaeraceae bacterium]